MADLLGALLRQQSAAARAAVGAPAGAAVRLPAAASAADVAARVRAAGQSGVASQFLPSYDKRLPEPLFLHGSTSREIEGRFEPGRRDHGWFGRGMYGTAYPEYAARWGENIHAAPIPDIRWAELWTDYRDSAYDPLTKHAHEMAGGNERLVSDERGYSDAFRSALMDKGVQGVRVHLGNHPDAELVVFDPEDAGVRLRPFASRRPGP